MNTDAILEQPRIIGAGREQGASYINNLDRMKEGIDKAVDALDSIPDAPEVVRNISARLYAVLSGETWAESEESVKPWVEYKREVV